MLTTPDSQSATFFFASDRQTTDQTARPEVTASTTSSHVRVRVVLSLETKAR